MTRPTGPRPDRSDPLDPALAAALREALAPPTEDAYWAGLESRIMARVRTAVPAAPEWWHVLAEWRTAGLVAAGLLLSVAGASLWREHTEARSARRLAASAAYWTVVDDASDAARIAFTVPDAADADEVIVDRYLFDPAP